jgi:hypothetical protein
MGLKIARAFELPLDAVTQTFGVLAKRGVGKTYTAAVFVEELLEGGSPGRRRRPDRRVVRAALLRPTGSRPAARSS